MATVTGLSQIGNALAQGAGDYANIQLRRQAEERQRAQQIADLQDQRRYMEDTEARRRGQARDDATIEILLKEGWLKPTDINNPEAIQLAANARQARLDSARTREDALPGRLQGEADYLGQQEAELAAAEDQLNAVLSAPQPPPPSPAEVRAVAIRMTGKPVPSDEEINGMMQAAADQIMSQRFQRWMMDKEDAKTQIPLLRSQRMALRQSLAGLLQQGFVPTRNAPPPSASLNFGAPAQRAATPEEMAAAAGITPPVSSPAASLQSPQYGGVMGVVGDIGAGLRTAGTALQNPIGAAEIGLRSMASGPARILNLIAGGDRRMAEGDAERAAGMAGAIERFNASPSAPLPANPFFQGNFMPPPQPGQLSRLPALPPLRKPPSQSPAFQFANSFAPGG